MKIGIQIYTLRELLNETNVEKWVEEIATIGYDFIELAGFNNHEKIMEESKKQNVKIYSAHLGLDALKNEKDKVLNIKKVMPEFKYAIVPGINAELQTHNGYTQVGEDIKVLIEFYKEHNIEIMFHNHDNDFVRLEQGQSGMQILAATSSVTFEHDTHWVHAGGFDVADYLKNDPRAGKILHLKDYFLIKGKKVDGYIGEGNLNMKAIIQVAKDKNMEFLVVEQETLSDNPKQDLINSLATCKKFLN